MTTTSTESALLRAIAAHPEEDTPRLMYADWCDENAGECPQCDGTGWERVADSAGDMDDQPCRKCRGAGVDFRRERAEFIRLQVRDIPQAESAVDECLKQDLWRGDPDMIAARENRGNLRARLSELWHGGVQRQFACKGVEMFSHAADFRGGVTVRVARGFAETLYLPTLADLCARGFEACPDCGGPGHTYVYDGEGEYREDDCFFCSHGLITGDYTGKPTALALDIMRVHPTITRVVVVDRRPWHAFDASMESVYQFVAGDFSDHTGERIPREIFAEAAKLGIGKVRENSERCVIDFSSHQDALDALAVAAGQWLRSHRGNHSE